MPGTSPEQHRKGQDQEDQENQEDQEEEHEDQEDQDKDHEDQEQQGEMGRPATPLWSTTPEYFYMMRHIAAGNFTLEQAPGG